MNEVREEMKKVKEDVKCIHLMVTGGG